VRGHITKRSQDSYSIVIDIGTNPATGKRQQQRVTIHGTKRDAEKHLGELLHQLDNGMFIRPGKTNLAEFLSPRTAEGYEYIVRRHLIPALGNIPLTQIKPEHLQKYYSEKLSAGRCDGNGGLSAHSVRHHHITLHTALESAVKWGLLARNPADAVTPPHFQRPDMHILDEAGMGLLLEAAKITPYYAVFYLALFTGMRRSELLALRWSDVDLILCELSVSRSLHHLRDGSTIFRQPKTARSRRLIALTPSTVLVLKEHKEKQTANNIFIGKVPNDSDLVFSHADGTPLLPDTITREWARLTRRLGLTGIRLHDARHTHASLMLKQGVHPKVVQERLGHASITTTLDTYSHVTPGLQQAAALRFDDVILPHKEPIFTP
jgi:integrase